MIRKQDLLDRAREWGLRPEVVEKDYVLGWLLAGIALSDFGRHWVFKGGTCIKKCFFETYRFSEDLDFSLAPDAPYTREAILDVLKQLARSVREASGIDLPEESIAVHPRQNLKGQPTFECRIPYRGPLAYPGPPRILLDLTQFEPILDAPDVRSIFHPYPDGLPDGVAVRTYSFNELLAEKTRALFERSRPRDLYDVVFLLENQPEALDLARVRELFRRKCGVKTLVVPTATAFADTVATDAELRSEWANMLARQLPVLPALDPLLPRLASLLAWIDLPTAPVPGRELPRAPMPGTAFVTAGIHYWGGGLPLETVRFAGANRLMVEFAYNGERRLVEPYSIRKASTGNILLYGRERGSTHIKAFNVEKIELLRATDQTFTPRYRVEFTEGPPTAVVPAATRGPSISRSSRSRTLRVGPTYVVECTTCGKRFSRTTYGTRLNKHKAKEGNRECPGRVGYLVDTRY